MDFQIRPLKNSDIEAVVQLSLRAWEPVFASFRQVLGDAIFVQIYPDWLSQQRAAVEAGCQAPAVVWVADVDGSIAGFITYKLDHEKKHSEVEFLAVDPGYQKRGIGTALNRFVLGKMWESGMTLAEVGTGGDPGHAAARRSYEKAGYRALPIVRYYQDLTHGVMRPKVFEIDHIQQVEDELHVAGRALETIRIGDVLYASGEPELTAAFQIVQIRVYNREIDQIDAIFAALLVLEGDDQSALGSATHLFRE